MLRHYHLIIDGPRVDKRYSLSTLVNSFFLLADSSPLLLRNAMDLPRVSFIAKHRLLCVTELATQFRLHDEFISPGSQESSCQRLPQALSLLCSCLLSIFEA